jgi:hypothetical protein
MFRHASVYLNHYLVKMFYESKKMSALWYNNTNTNTNTTMAGNGNDNGNMSPYSPVPDSPVVNSLLDTHPLIRADSFGIQDYIDRLHRIAQVAESHAVQASRSAHAARTASRLAKRTANQVASMLRRPPGGGSRRTRRRKC